jgi:hypothetical protein
VVDRARLDLAVKEATRPATGAEAGFPAAISPLATRVGDIVKPNTDLFQSSR